MQTMEHDTRQPNFTPGERSFFVDSLQVHIYPDRQTAGSAAAEWVTAALRRVLQEKSQARMVFAAAPSQNEFLAALIQQPDIDWSRVTAFQMDEYLGLPPDAPQLFQTYLHEHLFRHVPLGAVHKMQPQLGPQEACAQYARLLQEAPIDVVCMGIGENGHIAFNDPPVAEFNDPEIVKVVELEPACRQQQVNDGCFASIDAVPKLAMTMTIPALMAARLSSVVVPGPTKAEAVFHTLNDPISPACPATILRRHPRAVLFLDRDAAGRLE